MAMVNIRGEIVMIASHFRVFLALLEAVRRSLVNFDMILYSIIETAILRITFCAVFAISAPSSCYEV
jgi:hypothetical protein